MVCDIHFTVIAHLLLSLSITSTVGEGRDRAPTKRAGGGKPRLCCRRGALYSGEKVTWYPLFVLAWTTPWFHGVSYSSSPWTVNLLCYANLLQVSLFLPSEWWLPPTTLCRNNDKEVMKALSSQLARSSHTFVCCSMLMIQSFSLMFTDCHERADPDHYCQSDGSSDLKTTRICLIGSVILHCGLPAGELKF